MFCKQCGIQIKGTEKFCPGCGVKVVNKEVLNNTMTCHNCGALLKTGVQYCKQCGAKVTAQTAPESTCARCGAALRQGARFCKKCGSPAGVVPSEPEPLRCICGEVLKQGAKFCKKCGAPIDRDIPVVTIPVKESENITSVRVSDESPQSGNTAVTTQTQQRAAAAVTQQAGKAVRQLAKEAIRKIISMDTEAAAAAGEMRMAMNNEQASVLSVVVQSLLGR